MPPLAPEGTTAPQWVAKAHLNFDYFSFSAVVESYGQELIQLLGFPFRYKYENLDVLYDQRDLDRHAKWLEEDPSRIKAQIEFIKSQIQILDQVSRCCGAKLSIQAFEEWYVAYRAFLPTLGLVFGLELALEAQVHSFLSEEDFHAIAFADETPAAKEQYSLLTLAAMDRSSSAYTEALQRHLSNFAWLGNKMLSDTPFTKEQIEERIKEIGNQGQKRLEQMQQTRTSLEDGLQQVEKKLKPSEQEIVKHYRELLFLRTARADAVCRAAEHMRPLFSWIGAQLGYDLPNLLRYSKAEITKMLSGGEKIDAQKRTAYQAEYLNGQLKVVWGSWGNIEEMKERTMTVKGTVACKGYAEGQVKIIRDLSDLKAFERGMVLVAQYTNPNMVSAMEKAAAIVTDIGGMTSHAAIVSRELNKPCVIGTQKASHMFKDGDKVFVDANTGIVKLMPS